MNILDFYINTPKSDVCFLLIARLSFDYPYFMCLLPLWPVTTILDQVIPLLRVALAL